MSKSCVTPGDIRGHVNGSVRKLYAPDSPLQVCVPSDDSPPCIYVTRYGNTERLHVSSRVAEELIAAGFTYGN